MRNKLNVIHYGKKGIALVNVIILMTIVLMLSSLILTVSLYTTHMAKLSTESFELKFEMDKIANDFRQQKGNLLSYYLTLPKLDDDGNPITNNGQPVYLYTAPANVGQALTQIISVKRIISVTRVGAVYTLVVTNKSNDVLLTEVIDDSEGNAKIVSYLYGELTSDFNE